MIWVKSGNQLLRAAFPKYPLWSKIARGERWPRRAGVSRLGVEVETCSGLMWVAGASVPWTCWADTHVYNVMVGPVGWTPEARPGLRWLHFRSGSDPSHLFHIKVRADIPEVAIFKLEVDGRLYEDLQPAEGKGGADCG